MTLELRDWLKNEIQVELWETRPVTKEIKNEDETVTKEVVMDE